MCLLWQTSLFDWKNRIGYLHPKDSPRTKGLVGFVDPNIMSFATAAGDIQLRILEAHMPRPKIKASPAKRSTNPMTIPKNWNARTISSKSASLRRYNVVSPRRTRTRPTACPGRTEARLAPIVI